MLSNIVDGKIYILISDKYDKMVIEVMTSDGDKEDKIIRNISNVTIIDKMIKES